VKKTKSSLRAKPGKQNGGEEAWLFRHGGCKRGAWGEERQIGNWLCEWAVLHCSSKKNEKFFALYDAVQTI